MPVAITLNFVCCNVQAIRRRLILCRRTHWCNISLYKPSSTLHQSYLKTVSSLWKRAKFFPSTYPGCQSFFFCNSDQWAGKPRSYDRGFAAHWQRLRQGSRIRYAEKIWNRRRHKLLSAPFCSFDLFPPCPWGSGFNTWLSWRHRFRKVPKSSVFGGFCGLVWTVGGLAAEITRKNFALSNLIGVVWRDLWTIASLFSISGETISQTKLWIWSVHITSLTDLPHNKALHSSTLSSKVLLPYNCWTGRCPSIPRWSRAVLMTSTAAQTSKLFLH